MSKYFVASYDASSNRFYFNDGVKDFFFQTKKETVKEAKKARLSVARAFADILKQDVLDIKRRGGIEEDIVSFLKYYLSSSYEGKAVFLSLLSPYLFGRETDAMALFIKKLKTFSPKLGFSIEIYSRLEGTFYNPAERRTGENIERWKQETLRTSALGFKIISDFSLEYEPSDDEFYKAFRFVF